MVFKKIVFTFTAMNLTASQKRIQNRREYVKNAFNNKGDAIASAIVKTIAEKLGVSEPTIWADLGELGLLERQNKTS